MPLGANIALTAQAVDSATFTPPPLDTTLGLHEIYDFHIKHSPSHPLFKWHSDTSGTQCLTWAEVAKGSHRAAHFIVERTLTAFDDGPPPVIAVLAFTDTITSICLMLGIIRAGYQCFCISPRNSVTGIRHLLKATNSTDIVIHTDGPLNALALAALAGLDKPIHTIPLPKFTDLFPPKPGDFQPFTIVPPSFKGCETPAIIMHSSGSTSFPKARTFTHKFLVQQARVPWFGQVDTCNEVLGSHALPMFHAQGLYNSLLPIFTGMILGVFPPDVPASPPTPEKVIQGLVATRSTLLITVPSFLEYWARRMEDVHKLSSIKLILCGGAPLDKHSTTIYQNNGVPVTCYLAATEYGIVTMLVPKQTHAEGPEWFILSPHLSPAFIPQEEPGVFELAFLASPIHTPAVINSQIEGRDAYATGDLVLRHPSDPNLLKIHGRADDQIMLSTGEKTNPGPIEAIITRSSFVQTAIMFGRGRFQNGVIIEPSQPLDLMDAEALSKFRNDIWPAVEEANIFAPSHSRIFKEMIIVAHPSKPFDTTLKNTPKRELIVSTYQSEIEATYAAVAESAQEDIPPPVVWDFEQTRAFIMSVALNVLVGGKDPLIDTDDFFSKGADSLQATWIRNSILRALRDSSKSEVVKELPANFVYEHPSVCALTDFLVEAIAGRASAGVSNGIVKNSKSKRMEELVAKYSSTSPTRPAAMGAPSSIGEVVVLTGSTGSLGSQILASLVQNPGVTRVYALNRQGTVPVEDRQLSMWVDQGLNTTLLNSEKINFVQIDTTERLGIKNDVYETIRNSATLIIHNAWTVDFNLGLSSFEPNIKVLKMLIDLAILSPNPTPPRLIFTSTIGVARNWEDTKSVPEAPLPDMSFSIGSGYSESKCVGEHILTSQKTNLRVLIARIGQLSGTSNGSWRTTEWVPAMVKSGLTLGALPDVKGHISWIPLQDAAAALLEVAQNLPSTPGASFVHLVHPRPVLWQSIFIPMSEALGVPLVPYDQWLELLKKMATSNDQEPAVRLQEFFIVAGHKAHTGEAMGFPTLESTGTWKLAPESSGTLRSLDQTDALKWIDYWRRKRFL